MQWMLPEKVFNLVGNNVTIKMTKIIMCCCVNVWGGVKEKRRIFSADIDSATRIRKPVDKFIIIMLCGYMVSQV